MRFRILLFALLLAVPASALAQTSAWTTYLRANSYSDLLASEDDVWVATGEAGLFRYDRVADTFAVTRRAPGGLGSNRLTSLARDASGRLWVGTRSNGASRLSADGSRWDVVNVLDGLPVDSVTVLEAQGDTVWIGTRRGIALWNGVEVSGSLPDGNTVSFDTTFAGSPITGIAVVGDELWLSTRRGTGFAHLSAGLSDWRPQNDGFPFTDVQELASDGVDLFVHLGATVYVYDRATATWNFQGFGNQVWRVQDDAGVVIATTETGVYRWRGSSFELLPGSPVSTATVATIDSAERVVVATLEGLWRQPAVSTDPWPVTPQPEGPPGNVLTNVLVDGPRVYVTTFFEGFGRYDGARWRSWPVGQCAGAGCDTTFRNPSFLFALIADKQGYKWVGAWSSAIDRFNDAVSPPQFQHLWGPSPPSSELHTFAKAAAIDSSGNVWLGLDTNNSERTPIGIDLYDPSGAFVDNYNPNNIASMSGPLVHALSVGRNGRIWVGYDDQGADYMTRAPGSPPQFVHLNSTSNVEVRGIVAHGDSVWMITPSQLRRYPQTATAGSSPVQTFTLPSGSSQFTTHPLDVGPDGTVWAATTAGLVRLRPGGGSDVYSVANSPIADDDVRAVDVDDRTGVVWIATGSGLSRFDPHWTPPSQQSIPHLAITVWPNPVTINGAGLQLRLKGQGVSYRGAIYDLLGRRLRTFTVQENGRVFWDGRDEDGRLVQPGVYFVRAEAGGRTAVARIALLR